MLYLGVSFADATIYGTFDQAYQSDKVTVGAKRSNSKTGISGALIGGNTVGFKGNEDLGDGLKANFLIEFGMEGSDSMSGYSAAASTTLLGAGTSSATVVSNGVTNRQSYVGLSGGFGSVKIGKQYSEVFNAACAYDLGGCAAVVGSLPMAIISDADQDVHRSNQVNFNLNLVEGLSINVGKSYGEAVKLGANATNNSGDGTNYSISYRTGGFAGTLASETLDNTGVHPFLGLATALTATANPILKSATSKKKTTVTGLSYDISGMAKVAYTNAKATIGTAYVKANSYGVSVPLGAAYIAYEISNGDLRGSAAGASTSKLKASQLAFNYSLSKRTLAYLRQGSHTESTAAGLNNLKISTTAFGVMHSF